MRTINLKINAGGGLSLAHPLVTHGPDGLVYAITNVPDDVPAARVATAVSRVCLLHPYDDLSAWAYDWSEIAGKRVGAIINRYRVAQ